MARPGGGRAVRASTPARRPRRFGASVGAKSRRSRRRSLREPATGRTRCRRRSRCRRGSHDDGRTLPRRSASTAAAAARSPTRAQAAAAARAEPRAREPGPTLRIPTRSTSATRQYTASYLIVTAVRRRRERTRGSGTSGGDGASDAPTTWSGCASRGGAGRLATFLLACTSGRPRPGERRAAGAREYVHLLDNDAAARGGPPRRARPLRDGRGVDARASPRHTLGAGARTLVARARSRSRAFDALAQPRRASRGAGARRRTTARSRARRARDRLGVALARARAARGRATPRRCASVSRATRVRASRS